MRFVEDSSAGSLIDTAGFHAYHTVFNDITDTDSVLSAQFI